MVLSSSSFCRLCESYGGRGKDGRVAEGARLESVYRETYRGFESLSFRKKRYVGPPALLAPHTLIATYL